MGAGLSPLAAAGVEVGVNAINSGFNAYLSGKTNKATRKWNEKMYGVQRKDALTDWETMTHYNSPSEQMKRLKEAGLNPNLVYGNGADATVGTAPRSSSVGGYSPKVPEVSLGSPLTAYQDARMRDVQIDNMKTQQAVIVSEAALKEAQRLLTEQNTKRAGVLTEADKFNLELNKQYGSELKKTSLEVMQANLDKVKQAIGESKTRQFVALSENERRAAMLQPNLAKAIEAVALMRAQQGGIASQNRLRDRTIQRMDTLDLKDMASRTEIFQRIQNLKKTGVLQDWEIQLSKTGVTKNDPMWFRIVNSAANKVLSKGAAENDKFKAEELKRLRNLSRYQF